MNLFNGRRGPDFPTREIHAADLKCGMTIIAVGDGDDGVITPDRSGAYPTVVDDPVYVRHGECGQPCVYWTADDARKHWWAFAGDTIVIPNR